MKTISLTEMLPATLRKNINFEKNNPSMLFTDEKNKPLFEEDVMTETITDSPFQLIVWNDEVNTFEWVIETLMDICGHSEEQAEQCAMIIHTKGKYAVKEGDYDTLKPMCDAITERGINATIEAVVG